MNAFTNIASGNKLRNAILLALTLPAIMACGMVGSAGKAVEETNKTRAEIFAEIEAAE